MLRQSLLLTAPRQLEWVFEDLPPLQPNELLIQTTTGAISVGSELPIYCGTARSSEPTHSPRMTGYESVGVIINCGSQVQRFKVEDRVVASYGHRTHAIISEAKAIAVPDNISDAVALSISIFLKVKSELCHGKELSREELKHLAERYGPWQGYWAHYLRVGT